MHLINIYKAELTKLRYRPLYWLCAIIPISITAIVFTVHFIDINNATGIGNDPWERLWKAGRSMFTIFLAIPLIIFLVATALNLEHKAEIWKSQYTTPVSRSNIILVKLAAIITFFALVQLTLYILLILSGYLLNLSLPEMEFTFHSPLSLTFFKSMSHTFIALLGVLGFQYFLSFRFKSFLIPVAMGILLFIMGLILGTINNPIAHYFPYSFPAIVFDDGMFILDKVGVKDYGVVNSVEIYSILCFLFFTTLTVITESKYRNL